MTINIPGETPRQLGYRMPAEWEPHAATWLAWPHNLGTWPEQLEVVKGAWVSMIGALARSEEVHLLVNDAAAELEVRARLEAVEVPYGKVVFYLLPTVDVWIRDYGPTFLTGPEGRLAFNDWVYNGWGNKYLSYEADDKVAKEIARLLEVPVFEPGIVLEGGSIDVNGEGLCLTTEQCLLNPNRNPHLAKEEIEEFLRNYLGVGEFIWLGEGIAGDDTDGHVDDIARFVNSTTVICVLETDETDVNYVSLKENYERLLAFRNRAGNKLTVVPLPTPGKITVEGLRLPASYANFYIANSVVLVPTFDHPNDAEALGILRELFPGRKVIGIPCAAVVYGLGAIHCVTQQEPAGWTR
jgi:agmatine deiminase